MVLKLYATSIAGGGSGIVAFVLAEKQIPFELVPVDLSAGHHKGAAFLALHPFGQIPVIVRALCLFSYSLLVHSWGDAESLVGISGR
jgi:glutathione S-transferase